VEKNVEKPAFSPIGSAPCLACAVFFVAKVKNRPEIANLAHALLVNAW
jgi:hypothetical protein